MRRKAFGRIRMPECRRSGTFAVRWHVHNGGNNAYVDCPGNKLCLEDPKTGERKAVEIFVMDWGASNCIFPQEASLRSEEGGAGLRIHLPVNTDTRCRSSRISQSQTMRGRNTPDSQVQGFTFFSNHTKKPLSAYIQMR